MAQTKSDELDEIMLLIDKLDSGSPKHHKQQMRIEEAIKSLINKRVREAEINLMAKVLYNEGGLYKISKSTLQSYPKDNFEIANRLDVDGGEIYELNQLKEEQSDE